MEWITTITQAAVAVAAGLSAYFALRISKRDRQAAAQRQQLQVQWEAARRLVAISLHPNMMREGYKKDFNGLTEAAKRLNDLGIQLAAQEGERIALVAMLGPGFVPAAYARLHDAEITTADDLLSKLDQEQINRELNEARQAISTIAQQLNDSSQ